MTTARVPPKRILVIDDDPIGRKVVTDLLTAHGYRVVEARTGPEGVEKAAIRRPDLVICDVLLPQKSGFEVCFEIKRAPETLNVPVIFVSAVCRDAHAERHAKADLRAQGYFVKPFSPAALLARVRELVPQAAAAT
jgi:DNA-binding response OmpR family regulator